MSTEAANLSSPWGQMEAPAPRKVAWGAPASVEQLPAARAGAASAGALAPAWSPPSAVCASPPALAAPFAAPVASVTAHAKPITERPAAMETRQMHGDEHPTDPGADLADLFGGDPTPSVPAPTSTEHVDLADLFGTAVQEPAAEPAAPLSTPTLSVVPLGAPEVTDVPAHPDAPSEADAPPEAAAAPANPFAALGAVSTSDAPAAATAAVGRVAAQRLAQDIARAATPHAMPGPSLDSLSLANNARYTRALEFEPLVDRLLGLGNSGDPGLQAFVRHIELSRDPAVDRAQRFAYQHLLEPLLSAASIQIASADDRDVIFDIAYDEMIGIGPLGPLWRDDSVTEIMVSGPFKVTVERRGKLEITPVRFRNLEHLEQTARQLGQMSADDRAINSTNPLVTMQLPGARVQFIWRPIAVSKVAISIRKFGALMDMSQLMGFGSLTEQMRDFLADCVRARATMLVSGGTGSGKTTFINALSEFIPDSERVITIEDALELQLRNSHVEALVTKEAASSDDRVIVGQDMLLKASLRMRPDRIIVGEIRDGKGCAVMLDAANTGHSGTMTTIHADTPAGALKRMATLIRRVDAMPDDVARDEVATAIDVVVQVVRVRGRRFVSNISAVESETGVVTEFFHGEFPAGAAAPTFRRDSALRPDTGLALKMLDAGLNISAWEE